MPVKLIYIAAMPQRGAPIRAAMTLGLVLVAVLGPGCRRSSTSAAPPESSKPNKIAIDEQVDAPMVCDAGCVRLERCVPELAGELDADPEQISARLASSCDAACDDYTDADSALALRDCLELDSCEAYWGCVGSADVRPWLATVAPVGERTCANLCSQASACAIAKACAIEPEPGRRVRPGKPKSETEAASEDEQLLDPSCMQDQARRDELEERCVLQCEATPDDSRARQELIGCIDHVSCGGMLSCLDSWTETNYADVSGPPPGISETCDAFCTRAITCGAQQDLGELDPADLEALEQAMTSTHVECAVQCGKELEIGGDAARSAIESCTAVADCPAFLVCANEV
jgi:hypothetical protein